MPSVFGRKIFPNEDFPVLFEDGVYFCDPQAPTLNCWRIQERTSESSLYLDFDRYNGTIWVTQGTFGGSLFVSRFVEIIKDANADLLVEDNGEIRSLIRSASLSDGTVVGDVTGETFINCENQIIRAQKQGDFTWKIIQPIETTDSTGTSFYADVTTASVDGLTARAVKVKGTIPSDTVCQLKLYEQSDLVNEFWKNVSDAEFLSGVGSDVNPTTGEIQLKPKTFFTGNLPLRAVFNFSKTVTLKGSTSDGTDIYFESDDVEVKFENMETVKLGEIKQIDISKTGAITKADMIQNGWAICDGTTPVSQGITDAAITATPDLQDRFLVMSNDETSGTTGGAATHTLTVNELPAHHHGVTMSISAGSGTNVRKGDGYNSSTVTQDTGGGQAHNNLPPFYEIVYFIKVK